MGLKKVTYVHKRTPISADNLNNIQDAVIALENDNAASTWGQPKPVKSSSEMTNTKEIYLYIGEEPEYEYGHWYYYSEDEWKDSGLYGAGPKGEPGEPGKDGKDGIATDEQVAAWLEAHPEATTTVQDGAITKAKLSDSLYDELRNFERKRMAIPAGTTIPFPGDGWYVPNPIFNQGGGLYYIYLYDENGSGITITRDSDSVVMGTGNWRYAVNANSDLHYFYISGMTLEHYYIVNARYDYLYEFGKHTKETCTLSAAPATIKFSKRMAFNAIATVSIPQFDKEITDEQVLGHLVDYVDENSALANVFSHSPAVLTARDADTVTQAPNAFKKYKALDGLYFNNPTTNSSSYHKVVFYDTDGNTVLPVSVPSSVVAKKSACVEIQERVSFEIKDGRIRFLLWYAHGAIPAVPLPSFIDAYGWSEFPQPLGYISMDGTYNCVYTDAAHEDTGEQFVAIETEKNIGLSDQIATFAKNAIQNEFGDVSAFGRWFKSQFAYQMNRNRHAFRISTFNVARYGQKHWYRIKQFYQEHGVDIAGLQEVSYPLSDSSQSMWHVFSDYFRSWQFTEFSTNGDAYPTNERMFMSTSAYKIVSTEEVYYQTQKIDSSGDHRYYTKCEFKLPRYRDKRGSERLKMSVYNTQLEVSSPATTLAQAQELAAAAQADPNPFVIILGDTNDFKLNKPTWTVFENAGFHRVVSTNTATVSGWGDYNCIDNFFLSSRLSALDYEVINARNYMWEGTSGSNPLSDHNMVFADVVPDYSDIRCVNLYLPNCSTEWDRYWLTDQEIVTFQITPNEGYTLPTNPNKMVDCMIANPNALSYSNGTVTIDGSKLIGDVYIYVAGVATT